MERWLDSSNLNLVFIQYLDWKDIIHLLQMNKKCNEKFMRDNIWWFIYNREYSDVKIVQSNLQDQNKAYRSFKALKNSFKKGNDTLQPKDDQRFKVPLTGRLGELPLSQQIVQKQGNKFGIINTFSNFFVIDSGLIATVCVAAMPKFSSCLSILESSHAYLIQVNPLFDNWDQDFKEA